MPRNNLNTYFLCKNNNNSIIITNKMYRARNPLSAAKKAFREHKSYIIIYIYDEDQKQIYTYDTNTFFTYKKEHKMTR